MNRYAITYSTDGHSEDHATVTATDPESAEYGLIDAHRQMGATARIIATVEVVESPAPTETGR